MTDKTELPTVKNLPLCYTSLVPLVAERHGALTFTRNADYSFAANVNAVPLMAEEFPRAQLSFPIVFTKADPHLPVALLGAESGKNDFVGEDGSWREGAYVPAYLRRYPFALVGDGSDSGRLLLCGDMNAASLVDGGDDNKLFEDGEGTKLANDVLEFCKLYESSMQRTRTMVKELTEHELLEESVVNVKRGDNTVRIEGFCLLNEKKLRDLDDATLAGLTRRGVSSILSAHQFSTARFSSMFPKPI